MFKLHFYHINFWSTLYYSCFPRTVLAHLNVYIVSRPIPCVLAWLYLHLLTSVNRYPWSTSQQTLDWHFNHYLVDTQLTSQLTVSRETTYFPRHTIKCWSIYVHLSQLTLSQLLAACRDIRWVTIEILIECQEHWSSLNCRCLWFGAHDPMTLRCQGIETPSLAQEWEFALKSQMPEGFSEIGEGGCWNFEFTDTQVCKCKILCMSTTQGLYFWY